MTLWLYLHFPSLQLDTLYREKDVQTFPLIIVHGKKNEVVQLNKVADKQGIKIGMGLGTAASLCQELQVKPYDQEIEHKTLKHIACWLYQLTADITLFPPNGLLLRVSNMLTLYPNLGAYWQSISQHLKKLPVSYQYATGYSPYAARILARQKLNQISDDKIWLCNQINKQPLASSDIEPKDVLRLHKVGINKFSDLLSLPLADLSKRFHIEIVNYIGRVTGQIQHSVNFYIPPEGFEQYLELYYEISNNQQLEKPLLKLYQQLEDYLKRKDKQISEVTLRFHQRDIKDLVITVGSAQGEYKANKWWQLSQLTLESVHLAAPVIGITLKANQLTNKYAQSTDFFQGSQGSLSSEELIDLLTAKLGKTSVRGVQISQDHRPEMSNQLCTPLSVCTGAILEKKLRPTLLLALPKPLTEPVTLMPYPERIVTGWWDNNQVTRDYFIGQNNHGCWLWIYRDNNQHWFVHGMFS